MKQWGERTGSAVRAAPGFLYVLSLACFLTAGGEAWSCNHLSPSSLPNNPPFLVGAGVPALSPE
jgi:hypothetical protein